MPRTSTKKTVNSKTTTKAQTQDIDYKAKSEALEAKIQELMEQMKSMAASMSPAPVAVPVVSVDDKYHRRITITNISDCGVNLKTSQEGNATTFRLDRFGTTIPISVEDLNKCINCDMWLFTEGYVYINDKTAIEDNYLEDYYVKFLDVDKISNIMTFSDSELKNMIANTTRTIQETICTRLATKMQNNEPLDMNKVDVIGKACTPPIDIFELSKRI